MRGRNVAALLCGVVLSMPVIAAPGVKGGGELLILAKQTGTLNVVDPATLKVMASVPVGIDPHEVAVGQGARVAYVSNYGGGTLHTLARVDLSNDSAMQPIELGALQGPHGLYEQDGKLWFTVEGSKALARLDEATDKVDLVLGTGLERTHMIWVAPDQKHIVTSNVRSGAMSFFDAVPWHTEPPNPPVPKGLPVPNDWLQTVVKIGEGASGSEGFDISPDGKEVWVAAAKDGAVYVLDREKEMLTARLPLGLLTANRLKFTPDGKYVLVSRAKDGHVAVIDVATRQVAQQIEVGTGAVGILMEPGGRRAFVACSPDNYVVAIDLTGGAGAMKFVGKIEGLQNPDGMAWAGLRGTVASKN
jgi:YVTN family beta-propeller protein